MDDHVIEQAMNLQDARIVKPIRQNAINSPMIFPIK